MSNSANLQVELLSALSSRPFSTDELHVMPSIRSASGGNIASVAQELGGLQQRGLVGRQGRHWTLTPKGRNAAKPPHKPPALQRAPAAPRTAKGTDSAQSERVATPPVKANQPVIGPKKESPPISPTGPAKPNCRWSEPWQPFHKLDHLLPPQPRRLQHRESYYLREEGSTRRDQRRPRRRPKLRRRRRQPQRRDHHLALRDKNGASY